MHASGTLARMITASVLACVVSGCDWSSDPREKAAAYLAKGDLAAARIEAINAVDNDPRDAKAYVLLARVLAAQGDFITADRTLAKAVEAGAQPAEIDALRARVLSKMREYARMLAELNPSSAHQGETLAAVLAARGEAHLATGATEAAKESFAAALSAAPGFPDALLGQAQLALRSGDSAKAFEMVERVIGAAPRHSAAWEVKAGMLQLEGKVDAGLEAYQQASRLDPASVNPDLAAAQMLIGAKRFTAAQQQIEIAFKKAPNALFAHYVQALLDFHQGKHDQALVRVQEMLRAHPKFAPAHTLAGMTHLARGDLNQAEERLRPLLQAAPDDLFVRKLYATTLIRKGNAKGALEVLGPAIAKAGNDPGLLALVAKAHLQAKDFTSATMYYERIARMHPGDADALTHLGLARYAAGHDARGLATLQEASALGGDHAGPPFALAIFLLERREFGKALAIAQSLQSRQPKNPIGFNLAGAAQIGLGDKAAARKSFEHAAALDPAYWPAAANLARLQLAAGERELARRGIQKVLAHDKHSIEAMTALLQLTGDRGQFFRSLETAREADAKTFAPRVLLARAYAARNLGEQALAVAREAVAIAPDDPDAREALGTAQLAAGLASEALTTFRELTSRHPQSPLAHVRLAEAHTALSDMQAAETAYAKALGLKPHDPAALAGLARLYGREQRLGEALERAKQLQQRYPKSALGWQVAGDVLLQAKRYADSARAYDHAISLAPSGELLVSRHLARQLNGENSGDAELRQWLERSPNDVSVRMMLAEHDYLAGRYREAVEHYDRIVQIDPHHADALNNLASAYLRLNDPRALASAQAAQQLKPDDAVVLDTLGVAQTQFGKPGEAVETMKKAVARNPGSSEYRVHYALALAKSGEKAAAREELRKVAASGKPYALDAEAKALLGVR